MLQHSPSEVLRKGDCEPCTLHHPPTHWEGAAQRECVVVGIALQIIFSLKLQEQRSNSQRSGADNIEDSEISGLRDSAKF